MSQSSSPNLTGRGTNDTNDANNSQTINILISTTTGTQFDISVESLNTVEHLKKVISKKLKVNKGKIILLYKERELQDGTLKDNGIIEGSKIVLTPNVETGLLTQRAENTVMQALESLNDSQVNDFLSGKSPLNLSVRLGDHMMLIQLQLSTINPTSVASSGSNTATASTSGAPQSTPMSQSNNSNSQKPHIAMPGTSKMKSSGSSRSLVTKNVLDLSTTQKYVEKNINSNTTRSPTDNFEHNDLNSYLTKDVDNLESIVKSLSNFMDEESGSQSSSSDQSKLILEQSPIKSLSNLVSNSIKSDASTPSTSNNATPHSAKQQQPPTPSTSSSACGSSNNSTCSDQLDPDIFHSITSCLCKRLDSSSGGCGKDSMYNPCFSHNSSASSSTSSRYGDQSSHSSTNSSGYKSLDSPLLHKTSNNAITKSKLRHGSLKKHHSTNSILPSTSSFDPTLITHPNGTSTPINTTPTASTSTSSNSTSSSSNTINNEEAIEPIAGTMDNPALAEASRNLTQTLRKLSKKVFPRGGDGSRSGRITSGAVIESMKHHGKGIYSGTFSGTLNPALQDKNGRPKRDISTIIHILNDLLSAAPQCTRSGAKIYFEPTNNSTITGSQSAPVSPVAKSSPQKRLSSSGYHQGIESCSRCPPSTSSSTSSSSSSKIRYSEDYTGTIKSTTHRSRRTTSIECRSSNQYYSSHHHHHHSSSSSTSSSSSSSIVGSVGPNKVPSTLEIENSKTKYKLDQLRLVMQQKKERREARKLKNAPYNQQNRGAVQIQNLSPTTTTTITALTATNSGSAATQTTTQPPASSPNSNVESIIEEVDTVA